MRTVNYPGSREGPAGVNFTPGALGLTLSPDDKNEHDRVKNLLIRESRFALLRGMVRHMAFSACRMKTE
jgi:hypothetical protein